MDAFWESVSTGTAELGGGASFSLLPAKTQRLNARSRMSDFMPHKSAQSRELFGQSPPKNLYLLLQRLHGIHQKRNHPILRKHEVIRIWRMCHEVGQYVLNFLRDEAHAGKTSSNPAERHGSQSCDLGETARNRLNIHL